MPADLGAADRTPAVLPGLPVTLRVGRPRAPEIRPASASSPWQVDAGDAIVQTRRAVS